MAAKKEEIPDNCDEYMDVDTAIISEDVERASRRYAQSEIELARTNMIIVDATVSKKSFRPAGEMTVVKEDGSPTLITYPDAWVLELSTLGAVFNYKFGTESDFWQQSSFKQKVVLTGHVRDVNKKAVVEWDTLSKRTTSLLEEEQNEVVIRGVLKKKYIQPAGSGTGKDGKPFNYPQSWKLDLLFMGGNIAYGVPERSYELYNGNENMLLVGHVISTAQKTATVQWDTPTIEVAKV